MTDYSFSEAFDFLGIVAAVFGAVGIGWLLASIQYHSRSPGEKRLDRDIEEAGQKLLDRDRDHAAVHAAECERDIEEAGEACKTCGGDSQLLTELECQDCEGTGFERPEIPDVLETLKELIANGPIGVVVSYDTLKSAIDEIEKLRKETIDGGR